VGIHVDAGGGKYELVASRLDGEIVWKRLADILGKVNLVETEVLRKRRVEEGWLYGVKWGRLLEVSVPGNAPRVRWGQSSAGGGREAIRNDRIKKLPIGNRASNGFARSEGCPIERGDGLRVVRKNCPNEGVVGERGVKVGT